MNRKQHSVNFHIRTSILPDSPIHGRCLFAAGISQFSKMGLAMKITSQSYFPFDQQVPIYIWFYSLCYDENLSDFVPSNAISESIEPGHIRTRSLYFHVPFCDTICLFCPFVRGKFQDREIVEKYTQALIEEIGIKARNPAYSEVPVNAIFFGGGTPPYSMLSRLKGLSKQLRITSTSLN